MLRNLWRRKARSLLTILGIAIGVAAVVSLGAMADGLASGYGSLVGGGGADLLVSQAEAGEITVSSVDEQVGARLRQMSAIDSVSGAIFSMLQMEGIPYFLVAGHEPDEAAIEHFKIIEGQPLSGDKQVILGKQAAGYLKLGVGDTLKLDDSAFRVVGIFETGVGFEEGGAVITLSDAQALFRKPQQVNFYEVKLRDPAMAEAVRNRIESSERDVLVSTASDYAETMETVQILKGMAYGIAFIAILVGGLGMMNTMIMAVFEQTREIGVLRAVGWRRSQVLRMIMAESLTLSLLGGVVGVGLGAWLLALAARTPAVATILPAELAPGNVIQGLVVALVLGTVGGLYPAWRGANLQPIEALRAEGGVGGDGREPGWVRLGGLTFRNLWRRRARSALTMAGIAVGVSVIVALSAITTGVIYEMEQISQTGGAHLVAIQADVADMGYSVIDERVAQGIASMPEVDKVSRLIFGIGRTPEVPFVLIWGHELDPETLAHFKIVEGRQLSGRREIILGKPGAEALHKRVGDTLSLSNGTYRVVGIFETGIAYEEGGGVVALPDAQAAFGKLRQSSMLNIRLKNPAQTEAIRARILERFGDDVSVSLTSEYVENTNDLQSTQAMVQSIFLLAMIVGGVGITNTMIMTVLERTREIGVLRALGWRQRRVLGLVLGESLVLSAISGVLGILAGAGLANFLTSLPGMALISVALTPEVLVQGMMVALLLGTLGGLYPAWYASRLSPVEALRYE